MEYLLGRGGMAQVYYGWDVALERPVAVKMIDARLRDDQSFARRFIQEARAIAAWGHPNIPQVFYAGEQDGVYYYAMEYIPGADLDKLIRRAQERGELLSPGEVLHIARSVAAALDHAHSQGVIHRDVKPGNILIAEDGRVTLTDFGLAMDVSMGTLGEVFGSPQYIAPEQARSSAQAVPASDLYALGVVLYQLLTGTLPFDDPSPAALAIQHITAEVPRPRQRNAELGEAVEQVLLKALQKDPSERYQTGQELVAGLERAIQEMEASATPATRPFLDAPAAAQVPSPANEMVSSSRVLARRVAAYQTAAAAPVTGLSATEPFPGSLAARQTDLPRMSGRSGWLLAGALALALLACALVGGLALVRLARPLLAASDATGSPTAALPTAGTLPAIAASETYPPPTSAAGIEAQTPAAAATPANPTPETGAERRLVLFYNPNSLYVLNRSGQDLPVFYLAFERLDKDGNPGRRVSGNYWGQIYASFRDGFCLVVRRFGAKDVLEPEECQERQLVVRTPTEEQDQIFWTGREGAVEFRVLWREQEIGRCPVDTGVCEVAVP